MKGTPNAYHVKPNGSNLINIMVRWYFNRLSSASDLIPSPYFNHPVMASLKT